MGSSINYVWILFDNQEVIGWLADMTRFLGGSQEIIVLLEEDRKLQECKELRLEISKIEKYSLCKKCTFVGI